MLEIDNVIGESTTTHNTTSGVVFLTTHLEYCNWLWIRKTKYLS